MQEQTTDNTIKLFIGAIIIVAILAVVGFVVRSKSTRSADAHNKENISRATAHTKGNNSGEIEIVEFSDFECPACSSTAMTLQEIHEKYPEISIAFRHFPLPMHRLARNAALAAEAAGAQGKFWEMHNMLFEHQEEWDTLSMSEFREKITTYAKDIGIDNIEQFMSDVNNETYASFIQEDEQAANRLKLNATPTIFINGEKLKKASKYDIEQEIENIRRKQK